MSAILVDTSYLISLADPKRSHHDTAVTYLREALRHGVPLYLSAIVASEFAVKQNVTDLPLRHFEVLPFNFGPCDDRRPVDARFATRCR